MSQLPVTTYLLFQLFVTNQFSTAFPPPQEIDSSTQKIVTSIGVTGDKLHKLGFVVGLISFNQGDDEVRRLITESFDIARRRNIAVGFHIDDQMFWDKRAALNDKSNLEWSNWDGALCTSRKLDWGPKPEKSAPQLCLNSPAVEKAVDQRALLIGTEIKKQVDKLKAEGRDELFACVITGSESQIGPDFGTNHHTGYHALSNAGFSSKNSISECDAQLVKTLRNFISRWATVLAKSGLPKDKIYCHIAFTPQGLGGISESNYTEQIGFADPSIAFSNLYRPGFTTYPEDDTFEQIHAVLKSHGSPPWISAEGTNVVPSGMPGEPTMESYLAKMFNHGAAMVNVYSWGIGGAEQKNNFFRRATEGNDAISAYKKFLSGGTLLDQKRPANWLSAKRLQSKIRTIQAEIPSWVQRTHRPDLIQPLMIKLDAAIKSGHALEVDKAADDVLKLLQSK
ncbi:MAG TPA: hypothetical protein V6C97_04295 [Oculatellaceae cyanobacterium]